MIRIHEIIYSRTLMTQFISDSVVLRVLETRSRVQGGNGLCQGHVLRRRPRYIQGSITSRRRHSGSDLREIAISSRDCDLIRCARGWLDLDLRLHSIHIFVHTINRRHSIHTYAYYESALFHSYCIFVYMINRRRSRLPEVSARASRHIRGWRGTTMRT